MPLVVNGKLYNPIAVDGIFLVIPKYICSCIGIPVNVSLALTLICHCYLYRKPRNVFLFAIVFSNLTCFFPSVMELIYWGWLPVESVCHAYVAVVPIPHALLLLNMFLALVDRYLALAHPIIYQGKMTVRLASVIVIFSSILLVFLLKFVYIFGLSPLRCEVYLVQVKISVIILVALLLCCTVFNYVVYRQTKMNLSSSQRLSSLTNSGGYQISTIDGHIDWIELEVFENQRGLSVNNNVSLNGRCDIDTSMTITMDNEILSEIEMESTRTLLIGVTSLLIVAYIDIIYLSTFFGCQFIFRATQQCGDSKCMEHFIKELGLIPAFDGSIIFHMLFNKLSRALAC